MFMMFLELIATGRIETTKQEDRRLREEESCNHCKYATENSSWFTRRCKKHKITVVDGYGSICDSFKWSKFDYISTLSSIRRHIKIEEIEREINLRKK